jgi:methylmalonyl-CoA mutase N-terminal domain/subunit
MPYIIEAVKAGATVGEMAETLAEIFGREKEIPVY